jgi:hypothetical protein
MPFDAEEFAKLMARFDLGNGSEAEAMSAARMMRRKLAGEGLRFVGRDGKGRCQEGAR